MPAKKYIVRLSDEERKELTRCVKTGKVAAYKRQRAQILLKADVNRPDGGLQDQEIARSLEVGHRTIERTRKRLVEKGFEQVLERETPPEVPRFPAQGRGHPAGQREKLAKTRKGCVPEVAYYVTYTTKATTIPTMANDCTRRARQSRVWIRASIPARSAFVMYARPVVIAGAMGSYDQGPQPPSRAWPRRSTISSPRISQPPGAAGQSRYCRRAWRDPPRLSPRVGWRVSARTAASHRLPEHRDHRARPGCGCDRAPLLVNRRTRNAGRYGSLPAVRPPCVGKCRNQRGWSPPNATGGQQARPAAGATPRAPPVEDRRTGCCAQWRRGR